MPASSRWSVELLGERTGAGEHEGLAVAVRELGDDVALVAVLDDEHAVVDRRRGLVFTGDLVHGRLDEELVDERRDALVEGRREEQLLAALGGAAEDALHRLEEAEVAHVVGLVETVMTTSERSSRPCSMRSSMRPGVPMTMSTPRWSAPTWRAWGTPP